MIYVMFRLAGHPTELQGQTQALKYTDHSGYSVLYLPEHFYFLLPYTLT